MVEVLLSTGDAQILNAVPNPLWGIGHHSEGNNFTGTEPELFEILSQKWPGENVQGEALMRVRAELRQHRT